MSRPIRFDDQFYKIINDKIYEKFLLFFNQKVQSTVLFGRFSLQQALYICSFIEFTIGFIIFLFFFRILGIKEDGDLFFLENVILILGMFFGLIGFDAANNINKRNSVVYKYWRYFITFIIPVSEIINTTDGICYYSSSCSLFNLIIFSLVYLSVNLYLTKIAWSFSIRLDRNQELLIIHGRYLDKIVHNESCKITEARKFVPPEVTLNKIRQSKQENQFICVGTNLDDIFKPKGVRNKNPFLDALKKIEDKKLIINKLEKKMDIIDPSCIINKTSFKFNELSLPDKTIQH